MANFSTFVAEHLATYFKTKDFDNAFPRDSIATGDVVFKVALYVGNSSTPSKLAANDHSDEVGPGIGYEREEISFTDPASYDGSGMHGFAALINDQDIVFGTPTSGWGTITHYAVIAEWTGPGGAQSQVMMWGHLNAPQTVTTSSVVNLPLGAIKITFR